MKCKLKNLNNYILLKLNSETAVRPCLYKSDCTHTHKADLGLLSRRLEDCGEGEPTRSPRALPADGGSAAGPGLGLHGSPQAAVPARTAQLPCTAPLLQKPQKIILKTEDADCMVISTHIIRVLY